MKEFIIQSDDQYLVDDNCRISWTKEQKKATRFNEKYAYSMLHELQDRYPKKSFHLLNT
jgi:hypothetical protein